MNGYTQSAKLAIVLLSTVSIGLLAWVIFEAVAIHNETPPSTPSSAR